MTTFEHRNTRITRWFDIVDPPQALPVYALSGVFCPNYATAEFIDGKFASLKVAGRVLKKDGTPGERHGSAIYSGGSGEASIPEWLRPFTDINFEG